jgi:CHAT domain-containing protein
LAGRRATLEAVQDALREADVFHFSGHGVSTSDDGTLLLSPVDSSSGATLLNSEHLEGNALRCRLAVLSACHTAVGERFGPFNPHSLVQAFWRAGVPTVLATRWAVDSRVARRIVDMFYARLLEGTEPPIALQSAVVSIRGDRAFQHPAYWAGFHVFGSPISKQQGVPE